MKIVQSFWSKPQAVALLNGWESRLHGGWYDDKYHHMSWALSCLQLRRFYKDVELVTDEAGKKLLIDQLNLPYTKVTVVLDNINDYHPDLWALGKLYSYNIQEEPFLHIDGDIYIWKPFEPALLRSGLIAQHLEKGHSYYVKVMKMVDEHIPYLPETLINYRKNNPAINAFNTGLFGGCDVEFIRKYSERAIQFVNDNIDYLNRISIGPFNTIYEQVLFLCMANEHHKPVHLFTSTIGEKNVNDEINSLANFRKAPAGVPYIHLFGCNKKKIMYCREVAYKLKENHPAYYEMIMDMTAVFA
ncbi:hypothetical protein INP83_12375 [Mucilaginibacter sp. 21P]|uniref:DUF6734 family protein n=1 Tax=Mucilaginibacter sp. 21P TaxID=2778902 RepID=UPI001C562424|nr:DUF6734 family protein [Mucilaginibacter sp. 21P]QXV63900.1 hypothetical protein INP83_12375 [Mucilaginibacter sp. 21P]